MNEAIIDQYLDDLDSQWLQQEFFDLYDEFEIVAAENHVRIVKVWQHDYTGEWCFQLEQTDEVRSYLGYATIRGHNPAELFSDLLIWFEKNREDLDLTNIYKSDLFKYMEGVMVKDKPVVMTIRSVTQEEVTNANRSDKKFIVYFEGTDKGAILNKTNAKAIAASYGGETEDWVGKKVKLSAEFGTWFGRQTWALRVNPVNGGKK